MHHPGSHVTTVQLNYVLPNILNTFALATKLKCFQIFEKKANLCYMPLCINIFQLEHPFFLMSLIILSTE